MKSTTFSSEGLRQFTKHRRIGYILVRFILYDADTSNSHTWHDSVVLSARINGSEATVTDIRNSLRELSENMFDANFHGCHTTMQPLSRTSFSSIHEAAIIWNVGGFATDCPVNHPIRWDIPIFHEAEGPEGFRWTDWQTRTRLIALATGEKTGTLVVHYKGEPVEKDSISAKKESELAMRDLRPAKRERGAASKERELVKGNGDWELL